MNNRFEHGFFIPFIDPQSFGVRKYPAFINEKDLITSWKKQVQNLPQKTVLQFEKFD